MSTINEYSGGLMGEYPQRFLLGKTSEYGDLFLIRPSWDCGWYWSFGYLQNEDNHLHMDWLKREHHNNLYQSLKLTFDLEFVFKEEHDKLLWQFCEISETIYSLKGAAKLFTRGGSHYTENPDYNLIKRKDWTSTINNTLIPKQIDSLYNILLSLPGLSYE